MYMYQISINTFLYSVNICHQSYYLSIPRYELYKSSIKMSATYNKSDKMNAIIDIKRRFLSEYTISDDKAILPRRIQSEPGSASNTSYDDICGPWKFDNVPLRSQRDRLSSTLHIPKLITPEDVTYMRKQRDKRSILLFLEEKILYGTPYKNENQELLVKLLWQTFKFFKYIQIDKLFTDQQISTVLELVSSAHYFYIRNYWNTAEEIYKYFFEHVFLFTIMDPPKCAEIFTPNEVEMILKFFNEIYLENIVLLHLVCMTHYRIVLRLKD